VKRFRTRLIYVFERGTPIRGARIGLGRFGTIVWFY
jgi:hypothetical protein